ncbi:hypothetical protein LSH36_58g00037 [Paralvinella palmiformis]|uniref:Uncharacterized protein n=1 Tax=Paralvinella palmiformis TaxID=53620 RepID=A0AAD9K4J9_9ANNE|nr:hypothetical protein LSH36_58g00037 [Paralvinella palmiformis]
MAEEERRNVENDPDRSGPLRCLLYNSNGIIYLLKIKEFKDASEQIFDNEVHSKSAEEQVTGSEEDTEETHDEEQENQEDDVIPNFEIYDDNFH